MLQITQQQALNRWDKLPMVLREAIFSERNADILWSVCEDNHIPDDKIHRIAALVGNVLMGFVHPNDLGKEIKEALALNPIVTDSIVKEINGKIFAPIRSEINKALAMPIPTKEEIEAEEVAGKVEEKIEEKPAAAKEVRYMKPEAIEELIKILTPEEGKIFLPEKGEEVSRVVHEGIAAAPATPGEGPVILHKEEEIRPVAGVKKSLGEFFGFLGGKEIQKEAPIAVKVDIGENMAVKVPGKEWELAQPIILTDLKEVKKNDKLKEILESKPEVAFPLELSHIQPPAPLVQLPKEPLIGIVEEIKPEIKIEAKPFEIKISSDIIKPEPKAEPVKIEPIKKAEPIKIEPVKEQAKEKVKIVDFTAEAVAAETAAIKKPEIIQDIFPKPPEPLIKEEIKPEAKEEPKEEPKKKGFFSFLFRK